MSGFKIPYPVEQNVVCQGLVVATESTSSSMQSFVQWMLTGFGAGLTFLLGNADKIQSHVPFTSLQKAGVLFLWAVLFGILQRYLAMLIDAGTRSFKEAAKLPSQNIDPAQFFIIYISSLPPSVRCAAAWAAKSILSGNLTATGQRLFMACYAQCVLGTISMVFLLWALAVVFLNIN